MSDETVCVAVAKIISVEKYLKRYINKQGDLDDAREITAIWIYFIDNQEFGKGDYFIFLSIFYFLLFLHVYFNKKGKTQQNKSLYFNNIEICHFYTSL